MALLQVDNLTQSFGEKDLYQNVSFSLHRGGHFGVVGQNGTGKSTLLKLLLGELTPTGGSIAWQNDIEIGHIDQYAQIEATHTIASYLRTAFADLYAAEARLNELYNRMGSGISEHDIRTAGRLQSELEDNNFYSIDTHIARVAGGLGLTAIGMNKTLDTLSGGQRTKVILAKLLLRRPDVLLLDEPTNFLDAEHIDWLGEYLAAFEGSFLIVSHDFAFLDRVTNGILDIEFHTIKTYHGRYSEFVRQKEQRRADYANRYAANLRETEKLEDYIRKNKARASTAKLARSRQHKLDRMEKLAPPSVLSKPNLRFPCSVAVSQRMLTVESLLIGYSIPLLPGISFTIEGGQKAIVTGFNGIGKSTLFKTLVGILPALGGEYAFERSADIGYFEQDLRWDAGELTPLQTLENEFPNLHAREIRRALARCGVTAKQAMQPVASLSGGEQNKVKLCRLTVQKKNFLILDEPTNHLDAETKDALRDAIQSYPGTVLFVCHEREFYAGWIDRVIDIESLLDMATVAK